MIIFNFILLYLFSKRMLVLIISLISFVVIIILLSFPVEEDPEKESNDPVETKNKSENQNKSTNKDMPLKLKSSVLSLLPVYIKSISKYIKMKKNKIRIYGYHLLLQNENAENPINQKYILSQLFQEDISDLSKKMYKYYKNKILGKNTKQIAINKNKELSSMLIECLASLNYDWYSNSQNTFQKILFNSTDWMLSDQHKHGQKEKSIVPSYIRYKYEESLDNKILKNELSEDDCENFIISKHYEIGIVKSFKCDFNKYIITKIIKNINHNYYKIFSQGNPFTIKSVCKTETIPKNFDKIVKKYTSSNKVVLALAGKMVRMNYLNAQKIKRSECENNMIFLGFVILDGIKYAYR